MDGFPTALYLAPLEDVLNNPYVMFRLVCPTPPTSFQKAGGVESAAGLVNVIPQRRIYRMETVSEIEIFKRELLKRPLVLQCISHSGLGCGTGTFGCGIATNNRNWVLLINQTHPKVLGRLQMGADAAKAAMQRGHPFVLRYRFGTLLQRLHSELFENDVAFNPAVQYTEWEYAELVIRFPGKIRDTKLNPASAFMAPTCRELDFDFADIQLGEIKQVINNKRMVLRGPIPPVTEDEIREQLPGWTVNEITPLDAIGEDRPDTYNYAQAGRLYESFRKKKRQRPKTSDSSETREPQRPNAGMRMRGLHGVPPGDDDIEMDDIETSFVDDGGFGAEKARRNMSETSQAPIKPERRTKNKHSNEYSEEKGSKYDSSHLYPDVTIVDKHRDRTPSSESREWFNQPSRTPGHVKPFGQVHHRDSDRSSHSTGESSAAGADSGYSGDDGYGGYYGNRRDDDYDYNRKSTPGRHYDPMNEKYGQTTTQRAHENLGFHVDDHRQDDILRKHQEYVSKMIKNNVQRDRKDYGSSRDDHDYYNDTRYNTSADNHDQNYESRNITVRRDYYDTSRGYNENDDAPPPSYLDVTAPQAQSKFKLQEQEAMAESFI